MKFPVLFLVVQCGLAAVPIPDPFTVKVEVTPSKFAPLVIESGTANTSPDGSRPRLKAASGELVRVHFRVTRHAPLTAEDVLVHYFVVREEAVGANPPLELKPERVVIEGAATMDFVQKADLQGTFSFRAYAPGAYLLRVECQDPHNETLSEPFAALDLEVK